MAVPLNTLPSTNVEKVVYSTPMHTVPPEPDGNFGIIRGGSNKSLDDAYDFLCTYVTARGAALDIKTIRRKVDWHIVPLFYLNYLIQVLDKFLLSYAIVMGLPEDLNLKGNQLNNVLSSLWWAYLVSSAFMGPILNKVPVARFLAICMTCWGVIVASTAAVQSYGGLLGIRLLMGVFDAAIPPALMLTTSQYYTKNEAALRFEFWYTSVGSGYIFGGLISFGFQHVHNPTLEGWRIMFLTLGILSVLVGIVTYIFLPDTPMKARFLSDAEKTAILQHIQVNETGVSNHKFERSHIMACFTDPQIWILFVVTTVISTGTGIISNYAVTIVRGFGFNSKETALLLMPYGAVGVILTTATAFVVRYGRLRRWSTIVICYCIAFTGACLVAFVPKTNKAGNLIGIWMVAASIPTVGLNYHWITANVAGHTKRSLATASLSAAFALGNIVGPYAVQKKDAPSYQPARITLMAVKAGATVLVLTLVVYYRWVNRKRDQMFGPPPKAEDTSSELSLRSDAWANLTDKERKTFRYVL